MDIDLPEISPTKDYSGKFIALCGIDCSGKTTQLKYLENFFDTAGCKIITTKQHTNSMKEYPLMKNFNQNRSCRSRIDFRSIICLSMGDRLQHLHAVILPNLRAGKIVITDRYVFSLLSFILSLGYPLEKWILELFSFFTLPDLTVLFKAEMDTISRRILERNNLDDKNIDINSLKTEQEWFCKLSSTYNFNTIETDDMDEEEVFNRLKLLLAKKDII